MLIQFGADKNNDGEIKEEEASSIKEVEGNRIAKFHYQVTGIDSLKININDLKTKKLKIESGHK